MHTCPRRYPAAVENARNSAADQDFRNDNQTPSQYTESGLRLLPVAPERDAYLEGTLDALVA